jgi:hypothetical protein
MSRLQVTYPWLFNNLSGVRPASNLDDDFDAVSPDGIITIGTRVLAASYVLVADDDYSTFLCLPTNDMNLTLLAPTPPTNYSFYFSNQSATKSVTLIGTVTIDGAPYLNPVFPGSFGTLDHVSGGLVVYDGSVWAFYPWSLLSHADLRPNRGRDSIAQGDTSHVITHNLDDANAYLLGVTANWNAGCIYQIAQDANTITVEFANENPLNPGALTWHVTT